MKKIVLRQICQNDVKIKINGGIYKDIVLVGDVIKMILRIKRINHIEASKKAQIYFFLFFSHSIN